MTACSNRCNFKSLYIRYSSITWISSSKLFGIIRYYSVLSVTDFRVQMYKTLAILNGVIIIAIVITTIIILDTTIITTFIILTFIVTISTRTYGLNVRTTIISIILTAPSSSLSSLTYHAVAGGFSSRTE